MNKQSYLHLALLGHCVVGLSFGELQRIYFPQQLPNALYLPG